MNVAGTATHLFGTDSMHGDRRDRPRRAGFAEAGGPGPGWPQAERDVAAALRALQSLRDALEADGDGSRERLDRIAEGLSRVDDALGAAMRALHARIGDEDG